MTTEANKDLLIESFLFVTPCTSGMAAGIRCTPHQVQLRENQMIANIQLKNLLLNLDEAVADGREADIHDLGEELASMTNELISDSIVEYMTNVYCDFSI